MPNHDTIVLSGVVRDVFAHRFVLDADGKAYLADLGPKGAEAFPLSTGLAVNLQGERRPSEIKVTEIGRSGEAPVSIHHKKPNHAPAHAADAGDADPRQALASAKSKGWTTAGDPQRRPKHFEVLARQGGDAWTELHIDFAGAIKKTKPADAAKWHVAAA